MKQIDEATLAVLSRVTVEGNTIFLTCGQLGRKQYLTVNEILEIMGGKWNRKAKGHVFTDDPTDKLEQVLLSGEIIPPKKYGYFPTPPEIAMTLIGLAEIEPFMSVLEPSAGQGGIVDFIPKDCLIDCVELLPDNVAVLESKAYKVQQDDFLNIDPHPLYHRVVMNPPFEHQQDIDHVLHAWKCVMPGGKLAAIMSAGILFRENRKTTEFRQLVETHGYVKRLPEGSFKASGTGVNTCIVVMEKP